MKLMNELLVPGLSIGIIFSIIIALHGVTQQQIKNLQERLEAESVRFKDNTDRAERRLDEATNKSEARLREETTKPAERLAESLTLAETQRKEQMQALESSLKFEISSLDKRLSSEMFLQFHCLKEQAEVIKNFKQI